MSEIMPGRSFSKHSSIEELINLSHKEIVRSRSLTAAEAIKHLQSVRKEIITFIGYSTPYNDPQELECVLTDTLTTKNPGDTLVVAGATTVGIGAVYKIAKSLGFETLGVVSEIAKQRNVEISPDCDLTLYIKGSDRWGGYKDGTKCLTPTSQVLVNCSPVAIRCGGGDTSKAEASEMKRLGKTVIYYPMERQQLASL